MPPDGWLRWWQNRRADEGHAAPRYVVIDLETSGLDANSDHILAIGGVALQGAEILIDDSFEALIRQEQPSTHDNIAIHGISGSDQRAGRPEVEVLREFAQWRNGAPLLGWHIGFDMGFLRPAWQRHGFDESSKDVLDLAPLAQVLFKDSNADLDLWLSRFHIPLNARHSAAADAWMTAQLAARVLTEARSQGAHHWRAWKKLANSLRWAGA